ncbi:M36 family metallopeptidase [Telluribacter sp.]|uniref:M36 family metallopeptidase n=1 Tax=Telluribacter sp. TaxID=1978767 RepID=UPI002E0ECBE2|nr:M36 family metallopeptidase [Telluribacter sp.]
MAVTIFAKAQNYKQEARTLLEQNLKQLQLRSPDDVLISDAYPNASSGTFMVYIQQQHQGIRVLNSLRTLVFKEGKLVVQQGEFLRFDRSKTGRPLASLKPADALNRAMDHLDIPRSAGFRDTPAKASPNGHEVTFEPNGVSLNKIPTTLLWVPNAERGLTLAWQVGIHPVKETDSWMVHINAANGQVIDKKNLTVYCQFGPLHEHADGQVHQLGSNLAPKATASSTARTVEVNSATYRVIPYPLESPSHSGGAFSNVVNPWEAFGANNPATTLNWHTDGTHDFIFTRGNNVHAYLDEYDNNLPFSPSDTSSTPLPHLSFTKTYDVNASPKTVNNQGAALTNLFYWNNIIHNVMYQYGFDEVSGNFQQNNLGRGGIGTDFVVAQAQDGGGMNNANFATPSDGNNPRMQMYLWNLGGKNHDSSLDNGVIVHEYGHGISNRLTGGPSQVGCLWNWEQMGEGWSDFYSLMFTTDWNKAKLVDGSLSRTIGTYVLGQNTSGSGIRSHPYTTDMDVNPFTYNDLKNANNSVHYIGSIWATMVWDMTWEIIKQTGTISPDINDATASGGNVIAMKLVTEGLKLQPCSPGFVDGRNAILKADSLLYGGQYSCAIWKAFARRGLGLNASQGSSNSFTDQTASFVAPFSRIDKVADKNVVGPGEEITYTITATCGCDPITNFEVKDFLSKNTTYVSGGTYNQADHSVSFGTISLEYKKTETFVIKVTNNATYDRVTHFDLDASTLAPWETATLVGTSSWMVNSNLYRSSGGSWFVPNVGTSNAITLTSPAYALPPSSASDNFTTFSFWHYLGTEYGYDGGVIEISTDNGTTWLDLGPYIYQFGYNLKLNCCYSYLEGRNVYSGYTNDFYQTLVDLTPFAGQTIRLRFLFEEDQYEAGYGWNVDDLSLFTQTELKNTAYLLKGEEVVSQSSVFTFLRPSPLNIQSLSSGSWNNPATWSCGCIPQLADTVTINPTHNVVVDGMPVRIKALQQNEGNLELVNNATLELSNN